MASAENAPPQSLKESVLEVLAIAKATLTCFWFWVPILFALYIYLQLYLMCVNPLLLFVGPSIIVAYALLWEEKRVKARYGIKDLRILRTSDPMFSGPSRILDRDKIESLVEEYRKLLEKKGRKGGRKG